MRRPLWWLRSPASELPILSGVAIKLHALCWLVEETDAILDVTALRQLRSLHRDALRPILRSFREINFHTYAQRSPRLSRPRDAYDARKPRNSAMESWDRQTRRVGWR